MNNNHRIPLIYNGQQPQTRVTGQFCALASAVVKAYKPLVRRLTNLCNVSPKGNNQTILDNSDTLSALARYSRIDLSAMGHHDLKVGFMSIRGMDYSKHLRKKGTNTECL